MNKIIIACSISLLFSISCNNNAGNKNKLAELEKSKNKTEFQKDDNNVLKESEPAESIKSDTSDMIYFPSGKILIGSNSGSERHRPQFEIEIKAFYLDKYPVSVAKFAEFVSATSYITEAEKYGDSGIFDFSTGSWSLVKGAYWKMPLGPGKGAADPKHPVTHISWNDARAYAAWAGKRLPNEFEWEYAARNGQNDSRKFPWGNSETPGGSYMANTWQGPTATEPLVEDGFLYTSPLGSFAPSDAGLYDLSGNVWEWCSNTFMPYAGSKDRVNIDEKVKAIRGGSFMFDQLGAESYAVYGRSFNTVETSLFNTGFRCAR